ncbi:MAG: DUF1328 domain-containing protein [Sphingomonadaceae bacterium]|nr:DUF1328 domain-containing protein [Sphingomonadaceae bacterium]
MLRWAVIFLILGLVCGLLGFYGAEGTFMEIARILLILFLIVFVVLLVLGIMAGRKVVD